MIAAYDFNKNTHRLCRTVNVLEYREYICMYDFWHIDIQKHAKCLMIKNDFSCDDESELPVNV